MNDTPTPEPTPATTGAARWLAGIDASWLAIGVALFGVAAVLAYRPTLDGPQEVFLAVVPWLMLAGMLVVYAEERLGLSPALKALAVVAALGGFAVLVFDDENWYLMVFALYALCYMVYSAHGPLIGVVLALFVTVAWAVAWLGQGAPTWVVVIPIAAFVGSAAISLEMHRSADLNMAQAALIEELRETRQDLAASERSKGILEERARVAGEIHDTLAQGFTSIVLLSRAAQRSGGGAAEFAEIEATAQHNLEAARRLVDAARPAELEDASLREALDRHLSAELPGDISGELRVVGEPRRLAEDVEVTLLRAAQEALSNVSAHANASHVDVTISYLDDAVALDVRDDGVGFVPGRVADRGSLTGGQGLDALQRRTRSLAGELTIETGEGGGSVVSVLLPTGAT